ncbi:MAG TPA: hypothetical protein VIY27_06730 [Myxococcota bacterium]
MVIKKQRHVRIDPSQVAAGKKVWAETSRPGHGRIAMSSADFERSAPKTWIRWVDGTGEERHVLECELYMQPHSSGTGELVGMLHGQCPLCRQTFIVREGNKEMSLGAVRFDQAPPWLRVHWTYHMAEKHGLRNGLVLERLGRLPDYAEMVRPPRPEDPIPLISGTNRVDEPWTCDYCKRWAVNVYENVARDRETHKDRIISVGGRPPGPQGIEV